MPGVVSSAVFCPRADEDGLDVHWREVWGALRRGREVGPAGLETASTDLEGRGGGAYGGMRGCWRACGAGHMYNAYVCTCACVRAWR